MKFSLIFIYAVLKNLRITYWAATFSISSRKLLTKMLKTDKPENLKQDSPRNPKKTKTTAQNCNTSSYKEDNTVCCSSSTSPNQQNTYRNLSISQISCGQQKTKRSSIHSRRVDGRRGEHEHHDEERQENRGGGGRERGEHARPLVVSHPPHLC